MDSRDRLSQTGRLTAERASERSNIVVDQEMCAQRVGPLEALFANEAGVEANLVEEIDARRRIVAQRIHVRIGGQLVFLDRLRARSRQNGLDRMVELAS